MNSATCKFFLIVNCALLSQLCNAQTPWTRVTPTPVEQSINDMVKIPGTERLIAVADGATIMTSDDEGQTWDISLNPADLTNNYNLKTVYFIDELTGFIGTGYNTIIKTTDGGLTWSLKFEEESSNQSIKISDICFMNSITGFALGGYGLFLKTNNRGETWSQMDTVLISESDFHKIDNNKAYITSHIPDRWLKTDNGGQTWALEVHSGTPPGEEISNIYFLNDSTAVASFVNPETFCQIYKTRNYGETWELIYSPIGGIISTYFDFSDNLHGIALCLSAASYCSLLVTDDGGDSWTEITQPINWNNLYVTCYINQGTVFVAGNLGKINKSVDAGLTWTNISSLQVCGNIDDVQFANANTGFLKAGGGYCENIQSNLYCTTDGGANWNNVPDLPTVPLAFYFFSDSLGYIGNSELYMLNNGQWQTINTGFYFAIGKILFYDEMNGLVTGENYVIKTTDGGLTWSDITPLPFYPVTYFDVQFDSPEHIYLASYYKMQWSSDGGLSWQSVNPPQYSNINDFVVINNDTSFMVTRTEILKSIDGMLTWTPCEININGNFSPKSIYFPTPNTGYVVGEGEYDNIIKTTDGGLTWNSLTTTSSADLSCIYFSDENNGLIFGDLGLVMKTETGGVVSAENIPLAEEINNLFISPNPFSRELRIGFNQQPVFPIDMRISDVTGKIIKRNEIRNISETVIQTDAMRSGVYILSVIYQDGSKESRTVIKL